MALKFELTQLDRRVHGAVSSHDYGLPKEDPGFWRRLRQTHPYEPLRTIFIDDNETVLDAARDHGIAHLYTLAQPDSSRPPRTVTRYPCIDWSTAR